MTREEVFRLTYPLPIQEGYRDQHLRAVVPYDNPPPQQAYGGPYDVDRLREEIKKREERWADIQAVIDEGLGSKEDIEHLDRAYVSYQEALEKAIPMAAAGWKVYIFMFFVAVLVRPDWDIPWWDR